MEKIRFKKIAAEGQALTVEFEELRPADEAPAATVRRVCSESVHPDMVAAFRRLVPHFAILSEARGVPEEYIAGESLYDGAKLCDMLCHSLRVMSVTVGYTDERRTVRMSGGRVATHGAVAFKCPSVADDSTTYKYVDNLFAAVDILTAEAAKYLFEGKTAYKQGNLFDQPKEGPVS